MEHRLQLRRRSPHGQGRRPRNDGGKLTGRSGSWHAISPQLFPAAFVSLAGFVLFVLEHRIGGFGLLALALLLAAWIDAALLRDLALIAVGLIAMSLVPITTDISTEHMAVMGSAMILAVGIPYAVSRFVFKDYAIRFPVLTGKAWTRAEKWYLPAVVIMGYAVLPAYMVNTGVYRNWPAVSDPEGIGRLFLGTNVLGIWDELFFICTAFALLRRHLPVGQANVLQAVLFTSFLWELGFHAWAPLFIFPFALLQALIFTRTKSLAYIVSVHLLFDFVLFLVLIHAHNREWIDIFIY